MSKEISPEVLKEVNRIDTLSLTIPDLPGAVKSLRTKAEDLADNYAKWVDETAAKNNGLFSEAELKERMDKSDALLEARLAYAEQARVYTEKEEAKAYIDLAKQLEKDGQNPAFYNLPNAKGTINKTSATPFADMVLGDDNIKSFRERDSNSLQQFLMPKNGKEQDLFGAKTIKGHTAKSLLSPQTETLWLPGDEVKNVKTGTPITWSGAVAPGNNQFGTFGTAYQPEPQTFGRRSPYLADLIPTRSMDSPKVAWIEKVIDLATGLATGTGGAAVVAEGAVKPNLTWSYILHNETMFKLAVYAMFTEEMLRFAPFDIQSEARVELGTSLALKEEDILFAGQGTYAGLNAAAGLNVYVRAQVKIRRVTWGAAQPNIVIMNSNTWVAMILAKTTFNSYVFPGGFFGQPMNSIDGMRVVISEKVADGEAWVGDFDMAMIIYRLTQVILRMFQTEDDEIKNIYRMLLEEFIMPVIKTGTYFCKVTGLLS
jgi:hypothetical protein